MNPVVTTFLDELNHPFRELIEELRKIVLATRNDLEENIKWNGPNYRVEENDRVSIKVLPAKSVYLIFHCGAKVQAEPKARLLKEDYGLLTWKSNDRAVIGFTKEADFLKAKPHLAELVKNWLNVTL
jgi:hypothetical protein